MWALVYHRYGSPDVVEYAETEKPSPKDDEVLIRVKAAALNPLDWHFVRATPAIARLFMGLPGPREPRIGRDVAGRVEAAGKNVTRFKAGDDVFGVSHGAFAEYACPSESMLAIKPENVTFEQAAAVPIAGLTALQGLRDKGHVQRGHRVLINGASGGVGTFAVQVAKVLGADVTGVCSTRNVDLVRSLGADRVIDYTREDFTRGPDRYDMIFDTVGNHSFAACRRVMNPNATLVAIGAHHALIRALLRMVIELQVSRFTSQKLSAFIAKIDAGDLAAIGDMIASGKVTPVIDKRYKLSDGREAFRYFAEGHARGKVILSIT